MGPLEQTYLSPFSLMLETDLFSKTLKIFAWGGEQYPKQQLLQLQYANVRNIESWITFIVRLMHSIIQNLEFKIYVV